MNSPPGPPPDAVGLVATAVAQAVPFKAGEVAAAALGAVLSARAVTVWQADYVLRQLHPVAQWSTTGPDDPVPIDSGAAGTAFRVQQSVTSEQADATTAWLPLTSRGHRIGVVEIGVTPGAWPGRSDAAARCVAALAPLLDQAGRGDDVLERRRRGGRLSVPAEMQWQLLPSRGLAVPERFSLYAQLEPAELVSSDLYDWSYDGELLTVTVFDAVGEGVQAAQASELAVTALRNGRRAPVDMLAAISLADQALWDEFRGRAEVAALLVEHDFVTGTTSIIRAGATAPLRWRDGVLRELPVPADPPLGVAELTQYQQHPVGL